jgi:hypothetical protein
MRRANHSNSGRMKPLLSPHEPRFTMLQFDNDLSRRQESEIYPSWRGEASFGTINAASQKVRWKKSDWPRYSLPQGLR